MQHTGPLSAAGQAKHSAGGAQIVAGRGGAQSKAGG